MAKSILDQPKQTVKPCASVQQCVDIVVPKSELTDKVTRQYCELNLMGEWFADDPNDKESLGSCYH